VNKEDLIPAGKVVSIWRYPVKSMLGEELNSSYVTERGLIGDRTYALIDQQTGKIASAKNPSKWGKLFDFRAAFIDAPQAVQNIPPVRITFPDGTQIFSDQDYIIDHTLSKVFGRDVSLMMATSLDKPSYEEYWPDIEGLAQREKITDEDMPHHTFFDIAVIHILTTSTINRLRELYPEGRFEVRRFSRAREERLYREFMGGQKANDRRRYCAERHCTLHEVCDDDSAAGGPSQRSRYLAYYLEVQPGACRSLCISA